MTDKNDKEKKKQLRDAFRQKANAEFENSLPMSRELFMQLFDHLDESVSSNGCDHSLKLTEAFLEHHQVDNATAVMEWLGDKGAYCDCEVLANVEDQF